MKDEQLKTNKMFAPKDFVYEPDPVVKANVGKYIYHLTRKRTRDGILKEGLRNACVTEEYKGAKLCPLNLFMFSSALCSFKLLITF